MKYWVYISGEMPGCFLPEELAATPGFGPTTLVCPAEGEILEKNWRRAAEFEDLIASLRARSAQGAPPPPASSLGTPPAPGGVDALLEQSGSRLFTHVASLMKELEARREERAFAAELQRQLSRLKVELAALRERSASAEAMLPRIGELEESLRRAQAEAAALKETLAQRQGLDEEERRVAEKNKFELEAARRRLAESANDLAIRNRLVDKLSKDLSEKEVSLAKALALIRRLEQDLQRLDAARPETPAAEPASPAAPPPDSPPAAGASAPAEPAASAAPPVAEPPPQERSGAQRALSDYLRRAFPRDPS